MGRTIRITDEAFSFMRENQKPNENDQDTISRLIKPQSTPESQIITNIKPQSTNPQEAIDYARIEKIIKNAIESAMAR